MRERFETPLKALLIIGMALFLYSRLTNGSLYYYINQRFMAFTLFTVIGLVIVGLSYRFKRKEDEEIHDHDHQDHHTHHNHSHGLTWGGVALVLMPIVLGLAVPPQPLGASALANREINAGLNESSMPGIVGATSNLPTTEKNILDWWRTFRTSQAVNEDERIIGQEARVLGFVYQDERYGEGHLMVVRYTVSCCVADASALALVVASPEASTLENDQWVEVSGVFAPGDLPDWKMPVLVATSLTPVSIPDQPYLYP